MSPAAEAEAAHRIQRLEVAEWVALFSHAPSVPLLLQRVRALLGRTLPSVARSLLKLAARRRRGRGRPSADERRTYAAAAQELGWVLHDLDRERGLVQGALALVAPAEGAEDAEPARGRRTRPRLPARYVEAVRRATRDAALEKERFLFANLRLVVAVAKRYASPRLPLIDLVQEGNIGLMKAVDRFDVRKGYRFSTYASWWIRHYVARAVAEQGRLVRLPVLVAEQRRRAHAAQASYVAEHGRDPSDEEILAQLGVDPSRAAAAGLRDSDATVSLDEPFAHVPSGRRLSEALVDFGAPDPLEETSRTEWRSELSKLMEFLPAIERSIIKRHFGLDGTEAESLKDIADGMGRSRERARQLAEQGIGRLRGQVAAGSW